MERPLAFTNPFSKQAKPREIWNMNKKERKKLQYGTWKKNINIRGLLEKSGTSTRYSYEEKKTFSD
jgi:hypothetical protein